MCVCVCVSICIGIYTCRGVRVVQLLRFLAGPFFLKVRLKFHFYKKQVMGTSAGVILDLLGLTCNRWREHIKGYRVVVHLPIVFVGYCVVQELSNK